MANVDNLNFSVIINDADFDARCAAIEKRANELNTNLSNILQIDKVVGDSEAVKKLTEELGKTKKELADMISVNTEVAKAAEVAQKAAEAQAAEVDKLKKKLAELKKEGGSSDGDGSGMEALAQYHLDNAMAMEKENSYRKIGIELARDADDVARQLKTDFAYLAEEEKQEAEDMKKSMALIKEYISLEKQVAKLKTDLNVRKVSNGNADYTNAENKKLQDHIAKQQKLRAELDKLIQRYPQLKAVFDQTFNTARLEAAVEAERRITRETEKVTREKERQNKAIQAGIRHTANMTTEAKKLTMETGKVTKYWNQFKNILGGATSIYAMKTILSNMMDITGEFELQRTTLRAILQDANKADVIFEKIKGLALVSPFNFKELISYTKQLSAFSIPANELYDTTKMLADLSAGLGVEMGRLILAVGQVRSAAVLRGQELRQFTESGIPLLEALRQEFERLGETGITTGQVFDKISNRLVSFEMVKKVLTDMTEEGGKFYNMQEVQSETLKGKLSNLKDAYQMMFNEIGQSQSDVLKGAVDLLKKMMANWEEIGKGILAIIAIYGSYRAALVLVRAAQMATVYANLAMMSGMSAMSGVLDFLTIKFRKLWAVIMKNPYVALGVAVTAIGYAVYRLVTYQTALEKTQESLNKAQVKYNAELANEKAKLDNNISKLKTLREGTEEYEKLKNRILNTYGEYLTEVDKETIKTQGLANSYNVLASAIANANKQKFYAAEENKINEAFNTMISDVETNIKKVLSGAGVSDAYSSFVMEIVKGNRSVESIQDGVSRDIIRALLYGNGKQDTWGKEINEAKTYYENAIAKLNEIFSSYDVDTADYPKPLMNYQKKVQDFYKKKMFPTLDTLNEEQREKLKSLAWWSDNEKNNEGGETYAKKMKERYDEINNSLSKRSLLEAGTITQLENEKNEIEQINALFEGQILAEKKKESQSKENPNEKKIQELKLEYDLLKKVQSAYEDLSNAGFGNDKISKFFSDTLGADFKGLDFDTQINTITESLRTMGEEGQKAADVIMNSAKKVDISEITSKLIDSRKRMQEFRKAIQEWAGTDFEIIEEGIFLDISKIAAELNTKVDAVQRKADEMRRSFNDIAKDSDVSSALNGDVEAILRMIDRYGVELWSAYYKGGVRAIDELEKKEIESARKVSQEKIDDLAKKYVKELYFNESVDLSDLSQKNWLQLRKIHKKLQDAIDNNPIVITPEISTILDENGIEKLENGEYNLINVDIDSLKAGGEVLDSSISKMLNLMKACQKAELNFKNLGKSIKKVFAGDLSNLSDEELKSIEKFSIKLLEVAQDVTKSISELGAAMGNSKLIEGAEMLSNVTSIAQSAVSGLKEYGGWWGAVIGGIKEMANLTINSIISAAQQAKSLENSIKDMQDAYYQWTQEKLIKSDTSIFGSDNIKQIDKYTEALEKAVLREKELLSEAVNNRETMLNGADETKWWQGMAYLFLTADPVLGGKMWTDANNNAISESINNVNSYKEALIRLGNEMRAMLILVDDKNAWQEFWGASDEYKSLADIYPDLFNDDGSINMEMIDNFLDVVDKNGIALSDSQRRLFEQLKANYENYTSAMEGIENYLSGIFGDLASSIADNMIEAFIATGDAAVNMGDTISDVAKKILKDLTTSLMYSLVFDKLEKKIRDMYDVNSEGYISDSAERTIAAVNAMKEGVTEFQNYSAEFTEMMRRFQEETGVTLSGTNDTLKSSIQGITEETASRLANLINGIYSEVFRQGAIFDNMDINVSAILSKMNGSVSENTYQDYLMQIQANTYDTAQNTRKILERIDSVMASTGGTGGQGIKVYLQ